MTGRLDRDIDPDLGFPTIERRAMLQGVLARMRQSARTEPVEIDRFTFVRRLGVGGMGIVYLVHDPQLDRLAALKLLHPSLAGEDADSIAHRMRSEARAMARLDHPNVVRVLEVGEHEGRTFIVMEYVEGTTLSQWLAARPTIGWREIARVFLAAGEGLAAAHAAGLAHCDFKPDNVLIGVNGAVRVSDFGLVRAYEDAVGEWGTTVDDSKRSASDSVTSTIHLVGTPAFMAPEQLEGRRGTPRSDQFSFCVALYTALHGEAPFRGDTLDELRRAVNAGLRASAKQRRIPGELERMLARGLAVDPDARWPDLDQLLAALRRVIDARKRRLRFAALGLGVLVGVGFASVELYERHDRVARTEACMAEGQSIDEVWNDGARARLHETLSGASLAAETPALVIEGLDRQARAWAHARTESCLDARVRGVWDDDTLERSRWCLDDQRLGIEILVGELSRPDAPLWQAMQATPRLPSVDRCRDRIRLRATPTPPTNHAALRAVGQELWRARALLEIGQFDEGLLVARSAEAAADELGWAPLSAEVRAEIGKISLHLGDQATAEAVFEQAYFEAADAGADDIALRAAIELVRLISDRRVEALRWFRHAQVLFNRLEIASDDPRRIPLMHNLAIVHTQHGEYERARSLLEHELAILEPLLGPNHPNVARTLLGLADVDRMSGAFAQSEVLCRRALRSLNDWFGYDHPLVSPAHVAHGRALTGLGQLEQAKAEFELALAIEEQRFGPEHTRLLEPLDALASTLEQMGQVEQATLARERASTLRVGRSVFSFE